MISQFLIDLKAQRINYLDSHPIFARLATGNFTRSHYLAYLRETYHLVKHTPQYLATAANRVAETDERLSAYFRKFCTEEIGHELLCVKDIEALGENVELVLSGDLNPGVWGMVTQCYFWATHGNPIALLGDAFATEELGVARGVEVAKILQASHGIPRQATNFLQVHGSEDAGHFDAAALAIEWYAGDRDHISDISYATKMTYRNYGQLFTDVLELGDSWTKETDTAHR
jgi:pyrroloquinoline quinone (PQQ) biosynthesis protein C